MPSLITEEVFRTNWGTVRLIRSKECGLEKNYETDSAWLSAVSELIIAALDSRIMRNAKMRTIDEELSDEVFADREQSFEERIDGKIDRDLKAPGQLMTMKAIGIGTRRAVVVTVSLKQIESPTILAVESQ